MMTDHFLRYRHLQRPWKYRHLGDHWNHGRVVDGLG